MHVCVVCVCVWAPGRMCVCVSVNLHGINFISQPFCHKYFYVSYVRILALYDVCGHGIDGAKCGNEQWVRRLLWWVRA